MKTSFYRMLLFALMICFTILMSYQFALAAELTVAWDPPSDTGVTGYKVYYGTGSCSYGSPVTIGKVTSHTVTGLTQGQTYYIAVTSCNASSESAYSAEVSGVASDISQTFTVATSPSGLQAVVDGYLYTAPRTFNWAVGSSHSLSVSSPQGGTNGTRYVFSSWSDGGAQSHSVNTPISIMTDTAIFKSQNSLSVGVSPSGGGATSPSGTRWYDNGQTISLSATAGAGYSFSGWSGDFSGSANEATLTMNSPKNVTANFTRNQYNLTVNVNPSGFGSVSKSPSKSTYVYGEQVTLTAAPNSGLTFSNWSGNASGASNPILVTVNGNITVTANFASTPDGTPPARSSASPSGTLPSGTTSTTLSLTTNENATCRYSTTAGGAYSSMTNAFSSSTGGTSHSQTATGLTDGSTNNFYVRCQDATGNANTDDYVISFSVALPSGNIEAESGTLTSPMKKVTDSAASGNAYIRTRTNESGTAKYSFNIPTAGVYKIVARVYARDAGSDSFYFKIDSSAEDIWDLNPSGSPSEFKVWREDEVSKRGTGTYDHPQYDPYTVALTAGSHTITFRGREANAGLDHFRFVKVSDWNAIPPSVPTNLIATPVSSSQINLSWMPSTDNVEVAGYRIYGCQGIGCTPSVEISNSATNLYSDTGLSPSTTYVYGVAAYDAAGNASSQSSSLAARRSDTSLQRHLSRSCR